MNEVYFDEVIGYIYSTDNLTWGIDPMSLIHTPCRA